MVRIKHFYAQINVAETGRHISTPPIDPVSCHSMWLSDSSATKPEHIRFSNPKRFPSYNIEIFRKQARKKKKDKPYVNIIWVNLLSRVEAQLGWCRIGSA